MEHIPADTPPPALSECLFPPTFAGFTPNFVPVREPLPGSDPTAPYAPGLFDPRRLPCHIQLESSLPRRILTHMQALLRDDERYQAIAAAPLPSILNSVFEGGIYHINHSEFPPAGRGTESDVSDVASIIKGMALGAVRVLLPRYVSRSL